MSDDPLDWTLDRKAFEDWFYDREDEVNPRIEMCQDIIDDLTEPHRSTLEEYFYERLSMRDIMRRHDLTNVFYAHQRVHEAQGVFKDAWIERHGDL